jgi:hypothetical protein
MSAKVNIPPPADDWLVRPFWEVHRSRPSACRQTTPSAVRPAQEPARVQPVPVSPAPTSTGRVLFGIVSEEEIDELMQSGMASGGLVFGSPPPQGPSVKWDPVRAISLIRPRPRSSRFSGHSGSLYASMRLFVILLDGS